jgi:predicted  nucleic acid-binding Zn-ribbon protein
MDTFNDIKSVMDDLNSRRSMLAEQMKEFEQLQSEIQVLVEKSAHDPEARRKLEKLNQAFPEGLQNYQKAIISKVTQLESNFKSLEEGFKTMGDSEAQKPESSLKPKKRVLKKYM